MFESQHLSAVIDVKADTVVATLPHPAKAPTREARYAVRAGRSTPRAVSSLNMRGFLRLCAAVVIFACASPAHASPQDIYPLSKVQRGQTGYGMTTFAGTKPERFTFEVISVVPN